MNNETVQVNESVATIDEVALGAAKVRTKVDENGLVKFNIDDIAYFLGASVAQLNGIIGRHPYELVSYITLSSTLKILGQFVEAKFEQDAVFEVFDEIYQTVSELHKQSKI